MTTLTLDEMIEVARHHKMAPSERRAQRVSLIMGFRSRHSTLTREQVEEVLDDVEGHSSVTQTVIEPATSV